MVELVNVTASFPGVPTIEDVGFFDDYYCVTYHIPECPYCTKYFNNRDLLLDFLLSIKDKADFYVADYYLHRSLSIDNLLEEVNKIK